MGRNRDRHGIFLVFLLALAPLQVAAQCSQPLSPPRTTQPLAPQNEPRHEQIEQRIRQSLAGNRYKAIAFGDSNMFGWHENQLSQDFGETALNASVGGGTQTLLWELQAMDFSRQSPDYVLLLIGANNLGFSPCDVFAAVQADIAAVHAHFPRAKVIYVSMIPHGPNMAKDEDRMLQVNKAVKDASGADYYYLDVHDLLLCNHQTPCSLYKPGDIHLNQSGYDILNARLTDFVKRP